MGGGVMRNWISVFFVFGFILSLAAAPAHADDKAVHVGVVLFGDSRQPQVQGLRDEMKTLGFIEGKTVRYTVLNAKNDRKALPGLVAQLKKAKVDLLVATGGLEADTMRKAKDVGPAIPVVVLYVNAIVERKLVKSRRDAGWPVTGVDNLNAEISGKRVALIHALLPSATRILVLYYQRIAPSRIGVAKAREAAAKLGLQIDARAVTSREEVRAVMESLKPGDVDVMLTVPTAPIDNTLKSILLPQTKRLGLPLFTHSRPMAEAGALAAYGAPFYELGRQGGRLAGKVLHGIAPSRIPFEVPKRFFYTVNRTTLHRLDIQLGERALAQINDYVGK